MSVEMNSMVECDVCQRAVPAISGREGLMTCTDCGLQMYRYDASNEVAAAYKDWLQRALEKFDDVLPWLVNAPRHEWHDMLLSLTGANEAAMSCCGERR